jgi:hypothetical protein
MVAAFLPSDLHAGYSRSWDGADPFNRPMPGSNCYGSGDADNDGVITPADLDRVYAMMDGRMPVSFRADVNADGRVDGTDAGLLEAALDGQALPGWWESLGTRAERLDWLNRILAIDSVNEICYDPDWFVCTHFATQFHIRSAGYGEDLGFSFFDGGQPVYNLPVYMVTSFGIGHVSNAILVGDDPLHIDDWAFIEPITDEITPLSENSLMNEIRIQLPSRVTQDTVERRTLLTFFRESTGWEPLLMDYELMTDRPPPQETWAHGWDVRQPRILSRAGGSLLVERIRGDLGGLSGILRTGLFRPVPDTAVSLMDATGSSRLLDCVETTDCTWLLWFGIIDCEPGLFLTGLDPGGTRAGIPGRVSVGKRPGVLSGRIHILDDGRIWVFWAERYWRDYLRPSGIYGRCWNGETWSEEMLLSAGDILSGTSRRWRHLLDTCPGPDGELYLFWAATSGIRYRIWADEAWSPAAMLPDTANSNPATVTDCRGDIHLLAWDRSGVTAAASLGRVFHWRLHEGDWQRLGELSPGPVAGWPRLAVDRGGTLHAVWLEADEDRLVTCRSHFRDDAWSPPLFQAIPAGTTASTPDVAVLDSGIPAFAWLEVSDEACVARSLVWYDLDGDGAMDSRDLVLLAESLRGDDPAGALPLQGAGDRPLTITDLLRLRLELVE